MALVLGVNAGFVTTAPTSAPGVGGNDVIDNNSLAIKDTSPSNAVKITEIGWYTPNATEESNFEVGIYTHNSGDDEPEAVVGSLSQTNAKGTGLGWKVVTGLDISVNTSTTYWIAAQLDNTSTTTNVNVGGSGRRARKTGVSTLTSPWGTSSNFGSDLTAIYALVEVTPPSATDNMNIIGENVY